MLMCVCDSHAADEARRHAQKSTGTLGRGTLLSGQYWNGRECSGSARVGGHGTMQGEGFLVCVRL